MNVDELKDNLAKACRILFKEGHDDYIFGHASVRVPGTDNYWMKPSGLGLDEIIAEDLILIDFDGNKLGGANRDRHGEYPIHSEIYRSRMDVSCIIHTHPFFATLLAATGEQVLPITHDGVVFVGALSHYDLTSELILTREQGEGLAKCLGENRVLLMRNHGVVVVGQSIEEATGMAICLERAAKTQILARAIGRNVASSTDAEVKAKMIQHFNPRFFNGLWAYLNRKL